MMKNNFIKLLITTFFVMFFFNKAYSSSKDLLKIDWSFKGLFGKFDRGALQRGYQVYSRSMLFMSFNEVFKL